MCPAERDMRLAHSIKNSLVDPLHLLVLVLDWLLIIIEVELVVLLLPKLVVTVEVVGLRALGL